MNGEINQFIEDVTEAIGRHKGKITFAAAIGCLEIIKSDLMRDAESKGEDEPES